MLVLTIVPTILMYFIFLVTIARQDFYYTLDDMFFKKRKAVNKLICLSLTDIDNNIMTDKDRGRISELKNENSNIVIV